MNKQKITIIGAGNGGVTAAYHLTKNGLDVCIYDDPKFNTQINAINKNGGIKALDEAHGAQMLFGGFAEGIKATNDAKIACEHADTLMFICPSFAQEPLFKTLLPYLKDHQTIILMPGNFGGLVLNKIKNEEKPNLDLTFVDTISIPWACRLEEPGVITIMGIKKFLPMSIFPQEKKTEELVNKLKIIFPIPIEILKNPIVAGLENINFGGHPLLTTVNMGLLENFDGNFNYYRDCCSTATAKAAAKMDLERLAIGKTLDFNLRTELDAMNSLYGTNYKTVYDFNRGSVTHSKIDKAPNSSKARYITEDVPYLLVPCYLISKKIGLSSPLMQSCITIASAYNDTDYFTEGRTLEKMGLTNLSIDDLKKI